MEAQINWIIQIQRTRRTKLGELLKIGYTNGKQLQKRLINFSN